MNTGVTGRVAAFCGYAHDDARLLAEFKGALAPLREQAVIADWSDTRIEPGTVWSDAIRGALERSHLGFLPGHALRLIASRFVSDEGVPLALAQIEANGCSVLPILIERPRDSEQRYRHPLAVLQPAPKVDMWVSDYDDPANAWAYRIWSIA